MAKFIELTELMDVQRELYDRFEEAATDKEREDLLFEIAKIGNKITMQTKAQLAYGNAKPAGWRE